MIVCVHLKRKRLHSIFTIQNGDSDQILFRLAFLDAVTYCLKVIGNTGKHRVTWERICVRRNPVFFGAKHVNYFSKMRRELCAVRIIGPSNHITASFYNIFPTISLNGKSVKERSPTTWPAGAAGMKEVIVYRTITLKDLGRIALSSGEVTATLFLLLAIGQIFSYGA